MSASLRKDFERVNALLAAARDAVKDSLVKLERLRAQVRRLGEEPEA